MSTVVRFENVSKRYQLGLTRKSLPRILAEKLRRSKDLFSREKEEDDFIWALEDINFEVEAGQSLALIGPNGAGKTTILKLLANITKATTGKVETNGQLSALIELGAGFHPDLTGYENIFLNGSILGLKRKDVERHIDEIVAFSELERFIDTPVKRYSSGMKVRLGFAVAAFIEPDILLVDEVLAVGDASFRQKCIDRIHELLGTGTSIIFVSHNMWLVQAVCPAAIYIDKGRIQYSGPTQEAVELYDRSLSEQRARSFAKEAAPEIDQHAGVYIEEIEVLARDDFDAGELSYNRPAEVRIRYSTQESSQEIAVVVRIIRSDGVTCCMLRSSIDDVKVSLESGSGVISVILDPLQLRGGTFYVRAMLRDAKDTHTLTSKDSDWFNVAGPSLSYNEMNGVFEPNRQWHHQPSYCDNSNPDKRSAEMPHLGET